MPEHLHTAGGRQHEAHDRRDGRGLAGTVAAQKAGDAAARKRKRDIVDGTGLLVDLDEVIDRDGRG
jgi:hypothetical protein